ncbi:hypothetical protein H9P43_008531 [Blastocladiella emersonii ATCC 22665]|nr:hypothetical protein H9P43_008531 [Blastocladiella emersonii ATCC 22665]
MTGHPATTDVAPAHHAVAVDVDDVRAADTKRAPDAAASTSIPELPVENRINIAFDELGFTIKIGSGKKAYDREVLKGIASSFKAGRLTVIIGASGSGKTSLLNAIAGEAKIGAISGNLYLNGKRSTGAEIKRVSAFVHQEDVILGTQTVLEAVTMAAKLRLPHDMPEAERMRRVDETISMLGLDKCKHSLIGTATMKGISGGEKKRVSMAMELISNPPAIFLDESTSGLDCFNAWSVVRLLKDLAISGRTVVATLHQPSSEIFHMVDDLCIVSQGEIMYYGPAEESVPYFARAGYACPQYSNPADYFFMDILNTTSAGSGTGPYSPEDRIPRLLEAWKASSENAAVLKEIAQPPRSDGITRASFKYVPRFTEQFAVLLGRAGKNAFRNKLIIKAKLGQSLFMAVLLGLLYLNIPGRKAATQIQDRSGVLFFLAVNQVMGGAMGILSVFSAEKQVFQREYGAGYYRLPAFFFSKMAVEFPFQLAMPALLVAILYWMVGLQNDAGKFIITIVVTIAMALCGTAIGTLAACAFDDLSVALTIVPLLLLPLMLVSGLFASKLPAFIDWLKYLSPMKFGFTALVKNEFSGLVICPTADDTPQARARGCTAGEDVITNLNLDDQGSVVVNLIVMFALWAGLLILSYLALWRVVSSAKNIDFSAPDKKKKGAKDDAPLLTGVSAQ